MLPCDTAQRLRLAWLTGFLFWSVTRWLWRLIENGAVVWCCWGIVLCRLLRPHSDFRLTLHGLAAPAMAAFLGRLLLVLLSAHCFLGGSELLVPPSYRLAWNSWP